LVQAKFDYTGIRVRNLDVSIAFYTEKLGMQLLGRNRIKETNGEIADLKSQGGDQKLELNWYADRRFYGNGDEVDHLAFVVEDVDAAVAELRSLGVEVAMEPFNEGGSRLAFVKDPDGIWIELEGPRKTMT
jgi:lactoylglutathione lyase